MYPSIIQAIDSTVNPIGVECAMRLQYGTLDSLSRETFRREIELAKQCEAQEPGFLRMVAESFGREGEFDKCAS